MQDGSDTPSVGAAPHPPAGTFSPYSDREKGDGRVADAYSATLEIGETVNDSVFLPVTIRGVEERTKSQLLGFSSDERPAGQ